MGSRDTPGISFALLRLLADAPGRVQLGETGRAYTRNLSWLTKAERRVEVCESMLEERWSACDSGAVRRCSLREGFHGRGRSALQDGQVP